MGQITGDWQAALKNEFHQPYYAKLYKTIMEEYRTTKVFPPPQDMFNAFEYTPLNDVKVVILGQDPYHNPGEAMGLSFSVPRGIKTPPSLVNIYKEIRSELGYEIPGHGDLSNWAEQGVLLLNTVLSVEQDKPKSHDKFGWQTLTSALVEALSSSRSGLVFMLWGNSAKALQEHIADNRHTIIASSHPSPIGGSCNKGFFGSRPFSRANAALREQGFAAIDWAL